MVSAALRARAIVFSSIERVKFAIVYDLKLCAHDTCHIEGCQLQQDLQARATNASSAGSGAAANTTCMPHRGLESIDPTDASRFPRRRRIVQWSLSLRERAVIPEITRSRKTRILDSGHSGTFAYWLFGQWSISLGYAKLRRRAHPTGNSWNCDRKGSLLVFADSGNRNFDFQVVVHFS